MFYAGDSFLHFPNSYVNATYCKLAVYLLIFGE
jgi:hypothetical protein